VSTSQHVTARKSDVLCDSACATESTPAHHACGEDTRVELVLLATTVVHDVGLGAAAASPCDDAPQATVLTARQTRIIVAERDAALLVLAMGTALRLGDGAATTLSVEDIGRVRRLASLVHRALPPQARDTIRHRAARMDVSHNATPVPW
jgi:hypothetical protein